MDTKREIVEEFKKEWSYEDVIRIIEIIVGHKLVWEQENSHIEFTRLDHYRVLCFDRLSGKVNLEYVKLYTRQERGL